MTGTTGLQWEPNDDTNLYLRYSRGYKSGGWLGSNGLTPNPYADPEYVDSYEFGVKTVLAERLQVNTAVFYSDYDGFQTPLDGFARHDHRRSLPQPAGAGARRGSGGDLVADGSVAVAGELFVSRRGDHRGCCFVDNTDPTSHGAGRAAATACFPNGDMAQTLVGNRLPIVAGAQVDRGRELHLEFRRRDRSPRAPLHRYRTINSRRSGSNPIYTAPSFELADFRLLWNDAENRYTVIGFVKNALDEIGYGSSTGGSPTPVGVRRTVSLTYPRTYGMELQYRF